MGFKARRQQAKDLRLEEKDRKKTQRAEVEGWVAEHQDELVAHYGPARLFRDRLIVLHPAANMATTTIGEMLLGPDEHEVYEPLRGLHARIDREAGSTYAHGTLTRTVVGAGTWQKKGQSQTNQFIVIEGPGAFVRLGISTGLGATQVRAAERFVKAFNETAPAADLSPEAAPQSDDLATQLRQLGELHTAGVLNDDEFAASKQRLINGD